MQNNAVGLPNGNDGQEGVAPALPRTPARPPIAATLAGFHQVGSNRAAQSPAG